MYKGYLVNKDLIDGDPHFLQGCTSCHKGDDKARNRETAHKGMIARPSDNIAVCAECHESTAKSYKTSLHYTTAGLMHGVSGRMSDQEKKVFGEKVFEGSCRSCHASCGDCHVKSPVVSGVNTGLIKSHAFVRRDEGRTCALCHGGRVYPEFTGDYGGAADVHYQKGMICLDCHKKTQSHGDGNTYATRQDMKDKPSCVSCHKEKQEKTAKARSAHATHAKKVSCQACHASAPYRNCYDCHLGKGAQAKPGFILGLNPRDKKTVTTLRVVPTARDTLKDAGISMHQYDTLPNYWNTSPHNIRKRTERTRSCEVCHEEKKDFLTKETLIKNGSKANESLIYAPKPLKR